MTDAVPSVTTSLMCRRTRSVSLEAKAPVVVGLRLPQSEHDGDNTADQSVAVENSRSSIKRLPSIKRRSSIKSGHPAVEKRYGDPQD